MSANTARFFIGKKNDYSLTFAFFKSVVMVHVLREGSKEEETEMTAICQQVYRLGTYVTLMAFKILPQCPVSLCTERTKSALFSFFLGAIFDCNAEFPQWHGLEENHVS